MQSGPLVQSGSTADNSPVPQKQLLLGFGAGIGRAVSDGAFVATICDVSVHPDYQKRGIGRRIVKELVKVSEATVCQGHAVKSWQRLLQCLGHLGVHAAPHSRIASCPVPTCAGHATKGPFWLCSLPSTCYAALLLASGVQVGVTGGAMSGCSTGQSAPLLLNSTGPCQVMIGHESCLARWPAGLIRSIASWRTKGGSRVQPPVSWTAMAWH